jgi:thiol-disulfide isomerase/thioredoxin
MKPATRFLTALLVLLLVAGLLPTRSATAQDPAEGVEQAALRAHLQNLRSVSFTFLSGGNLGEPGAAVARTPVGDRLDRFDLPLLNGDGSITLDDLQRPTAFNFWASWCPPCRLEFPHLTDMALAHDAHDFDVLFVNTADSEDNALAFLALQPDGITAVLDKKDWLARRSSIDTLPTTLLIDTDGTILAAHVGVLTPTISDFFDAVAANPGEGSFNAADWPDAIPAVTLNSIDAADATPITLGQRALGTLTNDDFQHVYAFEGAQGDQITVHLSADAASLDPYAVLIGPDGERLAEGGDVSATRVAEISATLPEDGVYLVVATRFLGAEGFYGGDYSLTVTSANATPGGGGEGFIAYGQTVQGRVSGMNPRELYGFSGQAGDVVTLRVTHAPSDEIALQIEVLDPDKNRIAESDPSVDGETAVETLTLPADGSYRVVVKRPRSRDTENLDYTLTVEVE